LPAGTFAQKAELIAFIRALTLGKGKSLNIHTNSKYIFLVLHADAAIWKERGLLSGRGFPIKHFRGYLPTKRSISDTLPRTSKRPNSDNTGKNWADQKAKQASLQPLDALPASILALIPPQEPVYPKYTPDEEKEATQRGRHKEGAWWCVDGKLVLPQTTQWKVIKSMHDIFHLGRDATQELINRLFVGTGIRSTVK
jgi:hypothetical protein